MADVLLPRADGSLIRYTPSPGTAFPRPQGPLRSRKVYAAAHVVCDPLADNTPEAPAQLDWDATLAYRRYLWSYGLSVAEAMDTAQRGMGLDWHAAAELIRRSAAEARAVGGEVVCGAGTDHLGPDRRHSTEDIVDAYTEQCAAVEQAGGRIVLMASRQLATAATGSDDYYEVYGRILSQVAEPVIVHWLGGMFDRALAGYWGSEDLDEAMDTCLKIVAEHARKVDGIKVSLLDTAREVDLRRRLPEGLRLYTGDDFNYPQLIKGDPTRPADGHSDALLGIFDAIAPAASAAIQALDAGEPDRFDAVLDPTVPLARHVFAEPTYRYKAGIVFLAYLTGHQPHFRMVAGMESARSIPHLSELFVLADRAGLLVDPELAVERIRRVLAVAGVEQ